MKGLCALPFQHTSYYHCQFPTLHTSLYLILERQYRTFTHRLQVTSRSNRTLQSPLTFSSLCAHGYFGCYLHRLQVARQPDSPIPTSLLQTGKLPRRLFARVSCLMATRWTLPKRL